MSSSHRMMEASRRATRTLLVVAGLYVAIGLFIAASAAFAGDRLSAFLGFLIISGALGAGVMTHAMLKLTARLAGVGDRLDRVHDRLTQIERKVASPPAETQSPPPQIIDLAAVGSGNPAIITAATLERGRHPRLVTVIESPPPDEPYGSPAHDHAAGHNGATVPDTAPAFDETQAHVLHAMAPITTRNLLREWRTGMRDGDLTLCRRIFSALVDAADTATVLPLSAQLQELTGRTEARLREEFSAAVRARDLSGALRIGEQIRLLLPDTPAAADFEKLRPHLLRKSHSREAASAAPGQ